MSGPTLRTCLATVLLGLIAPLTPASSQARLAGVRSVSAAITARMSIGVRLHARQLAAPTVDTRRARITEMSLQIETASNVAWQLTLAAPSGISPRGRIEVMTAAGAWEDLSLDALSRIVVAAGDPTNPTVRHIRFRVHNAADIPVLERLHLQMETAS